MRQDRPVGGFESLRWLFVRLKSLRTSQGNPSTWTTSQQWHANLRHTPTPSCIASEQHVTCRGLIIERVALMLGRTASRVQEAWADPSTHMSPKVLSDGFMVHQLAENIRTALNTKRNQNGLPTHEPPTPNVILNRLMLAPTKYLLVLWKLWHDRQVHLSSNLSLEIYGWIRTPPATYQSIDQYTKRLIIKLHIRGCIAGRGYGYKNI